MSKTILESIGNTPLLQLHTYSAKTGATILAKQESRNPLGSVKCRIAVNMIETAERDGLISKETTIIEPTSGNTGIGLAFVCAHKKLRLILTMPESMSIERRALLKHLGAELVLTPAAEGMKGAIAKASELLQTTENSYMPDQFGNPANPEIHRKTTALEILKDTEGKVDIFVAGVGTGGTITGVSEILKRENPQVTIVAVEPEDSQVLAGGKPGPHKIQGIGAGFIPSILNTEIIDEIIPVSNDNAFATAKEVARAEGILCGISSGAALYAAIQVGARPENKGKNIVVILPDTGERYLSTPLIEQ
ncbi:cysteine synthase A [Desulforhopalus sp. IMCC35007]|uniref:cysteine synthase A n=1 Tax=Desulforhopalus sp. IMCC35007 TaxID=2569543 RepID=UPI0010AE6C2C|nr:cysteine synthase A [Desulforhopalus sp. IMCC35007]TKB10855.1 cysteine synthase A [Desulforhopalus sp. IMCC35007]